MRHLPLCKRNLVYQATCSMEIGDTFLELCTKSENHLACYYRNKRETCCSSYFPSPCWLEYGYHGKSSRNMNDEVKAKCWGWQRSKVERVCFPSGQWAANTDKDCMRGKEISSLFKQDGFYLEEGIAGN